MFVALLWLAAAVWGNLLLYNNTLWANGRLESTKTTLEMGVNGATQFVIQPQALAGGRLNLGAWGGFNEVIHKDPNEYAAIRAAFTLDDGAYLVLFATTTDGARQGVRLSADPAFPTAFIVASEDGEFLANQPMALPTVRPGVTHKAEMRIQGGLATVILDGNGLGSFPLGIGPVRPGVRSGLKPAWVNSLELAKPDGTTVRERFLDEALADRARPWLAGACAVVALLAWAVARGRPQCAAERLFALATVLACVAFALSLLLAWQYFKGPLYPRVDEAMVIEERYWKNAKGKEIIEAALRRFDEAERSGAATVLFLGSSQTWGAGARKESESFARVLERRLAARSNGRGVACIDAAVPGQSSREMREYYENELSGVRPDLVVVNLGNNDKPGEDYERNLDRIVDLARERKALVLLVMEANSPEMDNGSLLRNHQAMAKVAQEKGVALFDLHRAMARHQDQGFVWWDFVHLTSFGHRLAAEELYRAITAAEQGGPETTPARGTDASVHSELPMSGRY